MQCTGDTHCDGTTPACESTTHTCVECTGNTHCSAPAPFCDGTSNACVECLESATCTAATASRCDAGSCTPCQSNADCAHIAGKGVCDAGTCVQCTGKDYTACGTDSVSGRALVCDSLNKTCSTEQERSSGLCGACVSDAECPLGQLCLLQRFGSAAADVGYFCFWKRGDTANGAPALCSSAQPYVRTLNAATSIDAETADVCGLAASTCIARNEFRSKDCTSSGVANDMLCGFDPPNDARCVAFDVGVFRCTMRCLSSDDCPGTACNTLVAQPYCEL